jgi:DNA-directed RNA polymerase subunit K/omega
MWGGRKQIGTARVDGGDARPDSLGTACLERCAVIACPPGVGAFQFVVLATLRAAQLMRGCRPRVDGAHKATVIAQLEVSAGKVRQVLTPPDINSEPTAISAASEDAPGSGPRNLKDGAT